MPKLSAQPDKALAKDQLQALQAMLKAWGAELFMAAMFWILTKESVLTPFKLNRAQKDLHDNLALRNLLLKARQMGGTTFFTLLRLLLPAMTRQGTNTVLISQTNTDAAKHFEIIRRAYKLIGSADPRIAEDDKNLICRQLKKNLLHTAYSNRRELVFDVLDSSIRVLSAEVEESGQGITIHGVVASEFSRWPGKPDDTLSNVLGGLVPGGTLDKEATGNGAAGPFYEQCLRAMDHPAMSDARFHFYEWWWSDEYRSATFRTADGKKDISLLKLSPKLRKEIDADLAADERAIMTKFNVDLQQIAWRRETKIALRGNFDEKYPEDAITAFLVSGKQYFDRDILIARKRELIGFKPWKTFDGGAARIFHQRVPGRRYVIGADTATGISISSEDTDYCAAVVIDLETGEEHAAYRARVTPQDFAMDLDDLGRYFNNAIMAVERTGDGGTVILTLAGECRYPSIYKHKEWWKRERKIVEFEGFPTTTKTRPVALNFLNGFVCDHPEMLWDEQFINEALTFVRDEKGKPAAAPGAHDDTVSARWVAHGARRLLLGWWDPIGAKSERYQSADQLVSA